MGWTKTDDGGFAYNEGSLNFTLRGSAFHDTDGNGVPDEVNFENGRPFFMGIKNLRDFHFDVPRGYLVVNGNEYKLVDLDKNPENGEELQLFKPNVGFPQGEDRTNPAAYKKVAENKFIYSEGSLHYTLEGGAFHDNDNNGIPDGVKIIGPKPCFGADGTLFDTSVENFHFKVPSGVLIVNGQKYKLAELDDNPDNGYELVVPEVQGKLGWSKNADGGFVYKRHADNNPDVMGGLTLYGKDLVDTTGTGKPDGVEVKTIIIGQETDDGHRRTKISIEGLRGEVFLNHPEALHSFGVKGDANYNILIVKDHGNLTETLFTNISPKATINITNDTIVVKTDGNGDYNFTGNGRFKLNDDFITMNGGERELKVKVKNGKIQSIDGFTDEDVVKVSKSGNIRINGQKITLTANQDMDMYGKPARTSGNDLSGDSSGDTSESGDPTKVAGETEELTKTKSDLEYKSQDVDAETETADFTITAENLDADAVTVELVQKVLGTDKQEVDNLNGEIKPDGQPPVITAENQIDTDTPKISNVNPAANEIPAADKQNTIEIPAIELFDANELFDTSYKIFTPQEKTRLDTSETGDNFGVKYLQNLQLEEILPVKNIGADFVLNDEYKFNSTFADSSQCRKQEMIDFERKIQSSEMDKQ